MNKLIPLILTDSYKLSHHLMYPEGIETVFSNFTPRSVKYMPDEAKDIIVFGIQYTLKRITELFDEYFFKLPKKEICQEIKDRLTEFTGSPYDVSHFEELHDLGYLPIEARGLPEGSLGYVNKPILTYWNTDKRFYWLTNFLETLISTELWKPMHSASLAYGFRKLANQYKELTCKESNNDYQVHDFSFRGMQCWESAMASGMGFLTSSRGTDTLPAIHGIEKYYGTRGAANSVPASEHAVMTSYGQEDEFTAFSRILDVYPTGIVSLVSDSYDFFKIHTDTIYQLKDKIMGRDGKTVFRGDSGDPADIICGTVKYFFTSEEEATEVLLSQLNPFEDTNQIVKIGDDYFNFVTEHNHYSFTPVEVTPEMKGQIELLGDCFGYTVNSQGYKELDPHVGAIWGDGITFHRMNEILSRLKAKGWASNSIVFGIGSYAMGMCTRDSQGTVCKATYVGVNGKGRNIFKTPKTDPGKNSAKGLLAIFEGRLIQEATWDQVLSKENELKPVYHNGKFLNEVTFDQIRERLWK